MSDESYGEAPADPQVEQGSPQDTKKRLADTDKGPAYAFWLATITLILVSLVALIAMLIFKDVFQNATDVTTVLSALFTIIGTVVGTYFGIKTSGDTRDRLQGSIDRANETTNRAMAEISAEAGRRVMRGG